MQWKRIAGAVIAGESIGRRTGFGVEAERIALGGLAHFVFEEVCRTGRQHDLFAVQREIAVDRAERGGIDGMHAAVARHGAAQNSQAAGQCGALASDGCGGAASLR